jgi:hypothetical protein
MLPSHATAAILRLVQAQVPDVVGVIVHIVGVEAPGVAVVPIDATAFTPPPARGPRRVPATSSPGSPAVWPRLYRPTGS